VGPLGASLRSDGAFSEGLAADSDASSRYPGGAIVHQVGGLILFTGQYPIYARSYGRVRALAPGRGAVEAI
jgi:hypothetical protein